MLLIHFISKKKGKIQEIPLYRLSKYKKEQRIYKQPNKNIKENIKSQMSKQNKNKSTTQTITNQTKGIDINLLSYINIVRTQSIQNVFQPNKFIQQQHSTQNSFSNNSTRMKQIDQYTYNTYDTIGKGYSSQVYKGRNQTNNQQVAIKLIDLKFIKGQLHRKLLQNQIAVLKQLKLAPNIIQIHDVFNTKTNIFIVTELCNQDLSKTIKTKKLIPEPQAISILKQIVNGYRSVHANDIIHRDLKPANIFVTAQSIKIADFGFAVKSSDLKKRENYNVGSPVYMPYEALSDNVYSFKSDIWAIGVIFFQMLTGRTPWRAKTQSDLKKMLKSNSIRSLLPPKISKFSEEFLLKSLAFDPESRMSAEQIFRFFDRQSGELQMCIEPKKMFSSLNGPAFRTRAVSQDNSSRNSNSNGEFLLNNNISGPKTYKKINILKGIGEETTYDGKFLRTRATIKQKSSQNDGSFQEIDPKKISNQLVSQLHLCRFLFKLIQRIDKSEFVDESQNLRNQMTHVIFKKLNELKNLMLLDSEVATQFRGFQQFAKLYKICDQYEQKYQKSLPNANLFVQYTPSSIDQLLQTEIRTLYGYILEYQANPEQVRDEVILLDYLITLKQLFNLDEKGSLEDFHRKSKIEDIVEGKPTSNITKQHIGAINSKIRAMRIM